MGANNLTVVGAGKILIAHVNQYFTALAGDFLPRHSATGALQDNVRKLGRPAFRWKELHVTDLFLGGSLFDPSAIGADTKFAINSGATRADSGQPDFLRADGTGASATILATATELQITANNTSITISADIALTALTVAPAANNTALVDDTDLAGGDETKYTGEAINNLSQVNVIGSQITIDNVGTEISNRIGQYICLKTPTGEFMLAFVEDATTLSRCYRGFFFDDTGAPIVRGVLSNNDTLTIMSLGWVFLENNGTTTDVSYTSPIYSGVEPASPVLDDYWFDLKNRLWKRYDGTIFVQVDRMLLGLVVIDGTNCVAARSFDFTKSYSDFVDLNVEVQSNTEIKTKKGYSRVSVYGQTQELYAGEYIWDITANLESGQAEGSSTDYYIYVTEEGIPILSDEKYFDRLSELEGLYHPYHSWRCVGVVTNDGSSNFLVNSIIDLTTESALDVQVFTSSGTWTKPAGATSVEIIVIGGGGGGGGADGLSSTRSGCGGGGGGGGASFKAIAATDAGVTETITIGAAGTAGSATGGNGGTGGTSSMGSHASATGGVGGIGSGNNGLATEMAKKGGIGGSGSGGDTNIDGQSGANGITSITTSTSIASGGNGGSSHMGGGGNGGSRSTEGIDAGTTGGDYGGGGGGGADQGIGTGVTGGTGAAGTVIVITR